MLPLLLLLPLLLRLLLHLCHVPLPLLSQQHLVMCSRCAWRTARTQCFHVCLRCACWLAYALHGRCVPRSLRRQLLLLLLSTLLLQPAGICRLSYGCILRHASCCGSSNQHHRHVGKSAGLQRYRQCCIGVPACLLQTCCSLHILAGRYGSQRQQQALNHVPVLNCSESCMVGCADTRWRKLHWVACLGDCMHVW